MSLREDISKVTVNANLIKAVQDIDPEILNVSFEDKIREINSIGNSHVTKEALRVELADRPIQIVPISDLHLGHSGCNIEKFEKVLQLIYETPDCYTILLGDQTETATRTSIGLGMFEENFHIEDQMEIMAKALKPLVDSGKVLGALTGNHEMRIAYSVKINPAKMVADTLGIPYFGYQGYLLLKVGDVNYHIVAHHGSGSGVSAAAKLNASKKLGSFVDADLFLTGHTHGLLEDKDIRYHINEETGSVDPYLRHYVVCGSFLEYWNSYPEMKGLAPAITGVAGIRLDNRKKDIRVTM